MEKSTLGKPHPKRERGKAVRRGVSKESEYALFGKGQDPSLDEDRNRKNI